MRAIPQIERKADVTLSERLPFPANDEERALDHKITMWARPAFFVLVLFVVCATSYYVYYGVK